MAYSLSGIAKLVCIVGISAAVAGCTATGRARPLAFGPVTTSSSAGSGAILTALNGGILPQGASSSLTQPDRLRALEAEYQALEKTPLGQKVAWTGQAGGTAGEVSAGTPYQVGQQNCRQYTHKATIGGASVTGQGAACRNEDGSWTPLG
ncbi:hypothetical protein [Hoeflea ulvae]|uniref:Surface antigen domain-containing protein n=1 Tax=Hoeflea ulvae TaxID=2983764 RepID=A0ABT3YFC1_9HYPH|nr:hypothetical protein [Hoeflea ulvae]MCY0094455.1 hypothetical protein [Hoeflea ulvae]